VSFFFKLFSPSKKSLKQTQISRDCIRVKPLVTYS